MTKKPKSIFFGALVSCLLLSVVACNSNSTWTTSASTQAVKKDPLTEARESVVEKWKNEAGVLGTARFIEDTYEKYPDDEVIANIYFYCIAKEQYDMYEAIDDERSLETAIEYAQKIDPDYDGEFASDMQAFADSLLGANRKDSYSEAIENQDRYNNLTNAEKKEICNYIQSRYYYYDSISSGKGAQYSDTVWKEATEKYNLTDTQISIIWMNMYNY